VFGPQKVGVLDVGKGVVEGHRGPEGRQSDDNLKEGFEPRCHGNARVLGYRFDVREAGVVLVGGDGVAAVDYESWVGVDGLVWAGFGEDRVGEGHLDGGRCLEVG